MPIPRRFRKSTIGPHRKRCWFRGTKQPEDAMFQWRARHLIAVIAITITGISAPALAQTYPERPVKLVTQGAAGSGPDVIARIVTDHLGRLWGQQQMPVESARFLSRFFNASTVASTSGRRAW